jgi:hypothetical protein
MDGNKIVYFEPKDVEGLVEFRFPDGQRMMASTEDVARSAPLQDVLDSVAASGESILTFPSAVECSHLQHWCQAVAAREHPQDAGCIVQCLEVLSHTSGMTGRLFVAKCTSEAFTHAVLHQQACVEITCSTQQLGFPSDVCWKVSIRWVSCTLMFIFASLSWGA